ncbi:MAG: metallophosphoesterase [Candidatus Margulisbacteria bacterium]|nr:metallophosphoesterase [Candidatus Margulisiibacteriota bacterium]MBU1021380.1 metallophosphoesterase [Candidatus Margulisiibacteriota bacterium]MBU1729131.1 metallophosphoesterase [Candidatus Margulisiibacteriota bacterium]MBU1954804.1 metallophosphoesterase [Candidatus Margulisiibacteriota bacterium]
MIKITKAALLSMLCLAISAIAGFAAVPTITNVDVTSITNNSVIITWQTSGEASTSGIDYGISTSSDYSYVDPATNPSSGGTYTQNHYLLLEGLSPGVKYYYKVKSTNADGTTYSSEDNFTTLVPPTGTYLFSFAIVADIQYANGKANTTGARGRPYSLCQTTLNSATSEINEKAPDFTIVIGDMTEASFTDVSGQILTQVKPSLDTLTGQNLTSDNFNYYPIPGNHDKLATYAATNWITGNLGPLSNNRYGYGAGNVNTNSVFNYSFDYRGYHFVMMDSVGNPASNATGEANLTWLNNDLNANSGKKTFIFSHYPTYKVFDYLPAGIPYPEETVGGNTVPFNINNATAFNSTIDSYASNIAAIFSGHVHDNFKSTITLGSNTIPISRVASIVQFPIGYSIVKVYSNGYMQTFYKVRGNGISETARQLITDEGGFPGSVWQEIWLGPSSSRNYSHTFATISTNAPTLTITAPTTGSNVSGSVNVTGIATGETTLARIELSLDSTFLVTLEASGTTYNFTFPLNSTSFANGSHTITARAYDIAGSNASTSVTVTSANTVPLSMVISPNGGETLLGGSTRAIQWSASGSLATNPISLYYSTNSGASYPNTIATGLSNSGSYTWTVPDISSSTVRVKIIAAGTSSNGSDESNANFTINLSDTTGPTVAIDRLMADITADNTPTLTGIATDERSTISTIECKVDDGSWVTATILDGTSNTSSEGFYFTIPNALSTGYHTLYARAYDAYGRVGAEVSYRFYVTRSKPSLEITLDGQTVYSGDAISATPSVEGTLISAVGINTSTIKIVTDQTNDITSGITITPITAPYTYSISYQFTTALTDGTHSILVTCSDTDNKTGTWEVVALQVAAAGDAAITSRALNFPNPFAPSTGTVGVVGGTNIGYTLSKNANVKIMIFDIMGTKLREINCATGATGGTVGYNEVYFDGLTNSGLTLGNGIYIYLLTIDGKVKAKGKLTVIQ